MPTYVEYELKDGVTILIEASEDEKAEIVKAARNKEGNVIIRAKKSFSQALKEAKVQAQLLLQEIEDLQVNEAEIKFGLTTTGELGNLALGKIGLGVNYEVTLMWKKTGGTEEG